MDGGVLLGFGLAAIFASIVLLLGLFGVFTTERSQVGQALAALDTYGGLTPELRGQAEPAFADRVIAPLLARMTRLGRRLTPSGNREKMVRRLDLAGNPRNWSADQIYAYKAIAMLGLALLAVVIGKSGGPARMLLFGLIGGGAGLFLPDILLYNTGVKRQQVIQKALPDGIDLLTISVEAGLGFDAAVQQVAKNTDGPLAGELFRVLQEMQIGKSRSEAFKAMMDRTDVPELRGFVTSLVQADSFGIPIANVLREQSKEMRSKRHQRAEEKAQQVPVKILFPLIFFILPALFVVILGPGGIQIAKAFS